MELQQKQIQMEEKHQSQLTDQKSFRQAILSLLKNSRVKILFSVLGTFLLFLSGLCPFLDNILTSIFPNIPGTKVYQYVSYNVTIWTLSVMAAPVLIVAATFMKPYFLAYTFPVFSFTTSFVSYAKPIFSDDFEMRSTLYILSFGVSIIFMSIFWLVKRWIHAIYLADKIQEKTINILYEEAFKK